MPRHFAIHICACCLALGLTFATCGAAETKAPPLLGASREHVLERLGEPKSSIVAGPREVLLFERERVVLRNSIVVEVDLLPAEPVRRPPPPVAPPESIETAPAADGAAPVSAGANPEVVKEAPAPRTVNRAAAPAPTPASPAASATSGPLEIRAVRKAGTGSRPPVKEVAPSPSSDAAAAVSPNATPLATTTSRPAPTTAGSAVTPSISVSSPASGSSATLPPQRSEAALVSAAPTSTSVATVTGATVAATEAADATKDGDATAEGAKEAKEAKKGRKSRAAGEPQLAEESVFTTQTYVFAFFTIVGGVGFLYWRARQRQLELAATAVSRTPFMAPVSSTGGGARFTAETIARLDARHFEELVTAYYNKTGVVAVRTNAPPESPVHIKISWKGEPRPFAFVLCIAQPHGLIDAKPLEGLVAVLAAEDIRRGYVVTTGKFNVAARDLAEEKHITLLPGEIFLEKLNALPDMARSELMNAMKAAETTPAPA